jgi:hypothetical protein
LKLSRVLHPTHNLDHLLAEGERNWGKKGGIDMQDASLVPSYCYFTCSGNY